MKIAAVQMECKVGDVQENLVHSLELIEESCANQVDMICFPESVLDGYACDRIELANCARSIDSDEVREIASAAKTFEKYIMWTLAEKAEDKIFNSAILFDRTGNIQMVYRKTHLCREANEHLSYTPGDEFPTALVENIRVGAMICFDRHFPEVARNLKLLGVGLILHPTATDWFSPDHESINTAMMRTRAYENRCYILSVNQANYSGGSALFDPLGEVVSIAGGNEEIMYVEIDKQMIDKNPENAFELISTRQPEIYRVI